MVQNKKNLNSYSEKFDLERLEWIAERAKRGKGTNGQMSDLECFVYELMRDLVEYNAEDDPT